VFLSLPPSGALFGELSDDEDAESKMAERRKHGRIARLFDDEGDDDEGGLFGGDKAKPKAKADAKG
jgi:hypothetical protein